MLASFIYIYMYMVYKKLTSRKRKRYSALDKPLSLPFPGHIGLAAFRVSTKVGKTFFLTTEFLLSRCPLYKQKRKEGLVMMRSIEMHKCLHQPPPQLSLTVLPHQRHMRAPIYLQQCLREEASRQCLYRGVHFDGTAEVSKVRKMEQCFYRCS